MLVDADNVDFSVLKQAVEIAENLGRLNIRIRRAYGNWTAAKSKDWPDELRRWSVQPVHQFPVANGKNAADISLVIDAMDIHHEGLATAYCIVSGDSDFTRLAVRLREAGHLVIGIGRPESPFAAACSSFVKMEALSQSRPPDTKKKKVLTPPPQQLDEPIPPSQPQLPDPTLVALEAAISAAPHIEGWATLAAVGTEFKTQGARSGSNKQPAKSLLKLIKQYPTHVELKTTKGKKGGTSQSVRLRSK